jgi:hypothetical protein
MTQLVSTSDYYNGVKVGPTPQGAEVLAVQDSFSFASSYSINDIYALMPIPEDCVPVDIIVAVTDGDTGSSLTFDVGVLTAAGTALSTLTQDGSAVWISGSSAAQTGVLVRPTTTAITKVLPLSTVRRYVAIQPKVAGSGTAWSGTVTLLYRARQVGETYGP